MENYKGFVLNYSVGEPKPLVLTPFCLGYYSKNRRRKLANYSVCVGVYGGVCLRNTARGPTSKEMKGPGSHPAYLQLVLMSLWCQKRSGTLGSKNDSARQK